MRIAFVYPPMHVAGRPLDFHNLWDDPRGTTGSEIMVLAFAQEMAARGHEVHLFIEHPNAPTYCGVMLFDLADPDIAMELTDMAEGQPYDAVCVSLDVNMLRSVHPKSVRLCFQQINGFEYGKDGFDAFVDAYVSPSQNHLDSLTGKGPSQWPTTREKWHVIANGCYPSWYSIPGVSRIPGRVVHTSSPDRGLHLLLEVWPEIRKAVPNAELRVFYYSLKQWLDGWRDKQPTVAPSWGPWHEFDLEHMRRAHYVAKRLPELASEGVTYVGSVSRNQMARELCEASVLAYPCETIGSDTGKSYTEGFSVSTLEGCASGAVPVIAACDALGDIYGHYVPMVPAPAHEHLEEYTALVIRALTDKAMANVWRATSSLLAKECAWPLLAQKLEALLTVEVEAKRAGR